jgi:hypothetical protein
MGLWPAPPCGRGTETCTNWLPRRTCRWPGSQVRLWSSQDSVDTVSWSPSCCFELLGAYPTEMTVSTSSIVERLNVVRNLCLRDFSVLEDSLLDQLFLETPEEGFRHGIVSAISSSAHARLEIIGSTKAPPIVTFVLASLIRMNDRSTRPTSAYSHEHCIDGELAADRRLH